MSAHLAPIKLFLAPSAESALEFDTLDDLFRGTKTPFLGFENVTSQVRIRNRIVNAITSAAPENRHELIFSTSSCLEVML